ncbi:hypothetical protein SAOR_06570 [Salinisphaera orenii MK-B5]|uniref:Uncharacterized protein n=1 Tax=Salinisphaera orenii MK-B5 TaxID=856730 RepID=A0A423PR16_9GAMM|nr:hypothetical protein SAOR_06570 [Salinisphaera orenii MK-B5]
MGIAGLRLTVSATRGAAHGPAIARRRLVVDPARADAAGFAA